VIAAADREHEARVGGALGCTELERAAEVEQCELAVGGDEEVAGVRIRVHVTRARICAATSSTSAASSGSRSWGGIVSSVSIRRVPSIRVIVSTRLVDA